MVEDDSVHSDCDHNKKALFTSPDLQLDLRYIAYSSDECVSDPKIQLDIEHLSERKLLGPACTSEFELEEGQCVIFVLREVGDFSYQNEHHRDVANPDLERAQSMGVPLELLVEASSKLRPSANPVLSKVISLEYLPGTIANVHRCC
jgi:hypothetical protein